MNGSTKVTEGGYVPLLLALLVYVLMWTWHRGAAAVAARMQEALIPVPKFLAKVDADHIPRVPGTAVFLTRSHQDTPPLMAWLASPELAQRAQKLGEFVRFDTSLSPYLAELAILVTARFWTSHYEWFAHKRIGLNAGIDKDVVDAIARRTEPKLDDPKTKS